jgi:hypothetical protein
VNEDEAEDAEHPAVKVADAVAGRIVEHLTKIAGNGAATESARKAQVLQAFSEMARAEFAPVMADLLSEASANMADDAPARKLLEVLQSPASDVIAVLTEFLGIIGAALALTGALGKIYSQETINTVYPQNAHVPLSPADAANLLQQDWTGNGTVGFGELGLAAEAALSGISKDRFDALYYLSGNAPAPQELFEMFRRQIIGMDTVLPGQLSVTGGLKQGLTKDAWVEALSQLAYEWITSSDFVNAAVREQIPYDTAKTWAGKTGLDITTSVASGIDMFDLLFDVAGRPPGPEEAARMAHRGIIDWTGTGPKATTFQQAIAESDLKTKWTDALQALSTYVLSNGEVTNLVRHGFISESDAPGYYALNGVPADLAHLMIETALVEQIATDRQLTKGEIGNMYKAGLLTETEALDALAVVGYHGSIGTELVALWGFQREASEFQRIIQVIGRQVIMGTVTAVNAQSTLEQMGVPDATVTILLKDWTLARQIEVQNISAAQIASAVYYGVETPEEGYKDLLARGYSEYDAWRMLSIRMHGPINLAGGNPPRPAGVGVL